MSPSEIYTTFINMLIFEKKTPQFQLAIYRFQSAFSEAPESFLSAAELEDLSRMTLEKRRSEYLQSRWQLKLFLAAHGASSPEQITFSKIGEGKPVWTGHEQRVDFNLSHSGEYFAIVTSESGWVGVDIEQVREPQNLSRIASRFFSPPEVTLIEQATTPERQAEIFAKFWSGKEALIKAQGGGVFKHVNDVLIDETSWKIKKLPAEYGSLSQWQLQFFNEVPGYICSLAYKARN